MTAVGRQVEDEHGEKCDGDARDDEINGVKQRLAANGNVVRDVRIRLRTARVILLVLHGWNAQQVPLNTRVEVFQFDSDLQRLQVADARLLLNGVLQVDLQQQQQISEHRGVHR